MATQKEVAEHLDVGERHIRKLLTDSIIPGSKANKGLDIDLCRNAYINYLRNLSKQPEQPALPPDEIDIKVEQAGLVKQQRITQTLKNDILGGRSIPVEIVSDVLGKILVQVGGILSALPLNIKRKFPEIDKRVTDLIYAEVAKHQNEAANLDQYIDTAIEDVISEAEAKI